MSDLFLKTHFIISALEATQSQAEKEKFLNVLDRALKKDPQLLDEPLLISLTEIAISDQSKDVREKANKIIEHITKDYRPELSNTALISAKAALSPDSQNLHPQALLTIKVIMQQRLGLADPTLVDTLGNIAAEHKFESARITALETLALVLEKRPSLVKNDEVVTNIVKAGTPNVGEYMWHQHLSEKAQIALRALINRRPPLINDAVISSVIKSIEAQDLSGDSIAAALNTAAVIIEKRPELVDPTLADPIVKARVSHQNKALTEKLNTFSALITKRPDLVTGDMVASIATDVVNGNWLREHDAEQKTFGIIAEKRPDLAHRAFDILKAKATTSKPEQEGNIYIRQAMWQSLAALIEKLPALATQDLTVLVVKESIEGENVIKEGTLPTLSAIAEKRSDLAVYALKDAKEFSLHRSGGYRGAAQPVISCIIEKQPTLIDTDLIESLKKTAATDEYTTTQSAAFNTIGVLVKTRPDLSEQVLDVVRATGTNNHWAYETQATALNNLTVIIQTRPDLVDSTLMADIGRIMTTCSMAPVYTAAHSTLNAMAALRPDLTKDALANRPLAIVTQALLDLVAG